MTPAHGSTASTPAMGGTLLLTRSPAHNRRLLEALARQDLAGVPCIERPLMEVQPRAPSAAERRLIMDLDQFDHVIFVSQNAAIHGMPVLAQFWPQWPLALQWYAVGSATAAALAREGIQCNVPADFSSEGLLAMPALQTVEHQRVLIVRGAPGGLETLGQTLTARGATVDYLAVYFRRWHEYPAGLRAAMTGEQQPLDPASIRVAVVYSGDALNRLVELMDWPASSQVLIVPSQRVADMAKSLGFDKVEVAQPADDAMAVQIASHWRDAATEQQ